MPIEGKPATAADMFSFRERPQEADYVAVTKEVFHQMKADGARMGRVTVTGPDVEGDETGYPAGLWFEGWLDPHPNQLPFGTALVEGGPIFPPLTYAQVAS